MYRNSEAACVHSKTTTCCESSNCFALAWVWPGLLTYIASSYLLAAERIHALFMASAVGPSSSRTRCGPLTSCAYTLVPHRTNLLSPPASTRSRACVKVADMADAPEEQAAAAVDAAEQVGLVQAACEHSQERSSQLAPWLFYPTLR